MRIYPRFSPNSTASSEFVMSGQPVLLLAACRTVKSDRLLALEQNRMRRSLKNTLAAPLATLEVQPK